MTEETIFAEALARPAADRAAYLDAACAGKPDLRQRVDALLQAHEASGGFLNPPADQDATGAHTPQAVTSGTADFHPEIEAGVVIAGRYTLQEKTGEGGMGEVWVAKQTEPIKRRVALKLIKAGMDSKAVIQRFELERQALGMMDHPNIAKILDGGLTQDRRPFFVMELVNGLPLNKFCDEAKLTPKDRLELFVPICQAVQHAHQKGIVHRDLKPSNILITLIDGRPVPKVIDFGVAKATGGKLTDESMSTQFGAVVGTLEYMSPEQAGFSGVDVDTRADIYSLGVILYETLTGLKPIDAKRLKQAAFTEMVRIIQEDVPSKPSTRLSTDDALPSLAALRQTEPKKLMALLRGELDWVVMKCLEKSRERRYETVNSLGRDIQRYLADEPVEARPPSAGYRLGKFLKRNKGPVIAASLVLLVLLTGVAGTTLGLIEARNQTAEAKKQEGLAHDEATAKEKARQAEAEQRVRAEKFRDQALDALRATTSDDVEKLLGEKKELSANEREYLEAIAKRWQGFARQEGTDEQARAIRAEGHNRVAYLWQKLGWREQARPEYERAIGLREKLTADFPAVPAYRQELAGSQDNLGALLAELGNQSGAEELFREGLANRVKLAADFPTVPAYRQDLAVGHNNLGILLAGLGRWSEAEKQYRKALSFNQELVADFPVVPAYRQDLAHRHDNLGFLFADLGKRSEAAELFRQGLAIREKLADDFPTVPAYRRELARNHNNLGVQLQHLGKWPTAAEQCRQGLAIQEKLSDDFPAVSAYRQELAWSHANLGNLLAGLGKRPEAEEQYLKALSINGKLATDFPAVPAYRAELAANHNNLGSLLDDLGKRSEAEEHYRTGLSIREKLATDFPAVPRYRQDLAGSQHNLGLLLAKLGKWPEAEVQHRKALAIQAKFAEDFPTVPAYCQELARSHIMLGLLLAKLGKWPEAEVQHREALAIQAKLAEDFPAVPAYHVELGGNYCNFGSLLRDSGKPAESLPWFQKAIDTLRPILEAEPSDVTARKYLRNSHWSRADAYDRLQKFAEAIKDWDRAIELSPPLEQPRFRAQRVNSRIQAGQIAGAIAEASELTKLSGWKAGQWYNFACVYAVASAKIVDKKPEYSDRAMELLHKAVNAGYKDAAHMKKDTDLDPLRDRDDFKKLLADLEKKSAPKP